MLTRLSLDIHPKLLSFLRLKTITHRNLYGPNFWQKTCLILGLLLNLNAISQEGVYQHYTVNDGLPSSQVYNSIQDEAGYMWFSTDRGVTRFNGYVFEKFAAQKGPGRNAVFRVQEDDSGRIWCVVLNNSWYYFKNGKFVEYRYNSRIDEKMKKLIPSFFHMDQKHTLWFGFNNSNAKALYSIDVQGDFQSHTQLTKIPYFDKLQNSNLNHTYKQVLPLNNLDSLNAIREKLNKAILMNDLSPTSFKSHYFKRYAFREDTVFSFDSKHGTTTRFMPDKNMKTLMVDKSNDLWVSSPSIGAFRFTNGDLNSEPTLFLEGKSVTSVYQDKEGGYWFTTLNNGIFYLANPKSKVYNHNSNLPNNYATSVYIHDDTVYCGHSNGQISELHKKEIDYELGKVYQNSGFIYDIFRDTNNQKGIILTNRLIHDIPKGFTSVEGSSFLNHKDTIYTFDHRSLLYEIAPNGDTLNIFEDLPANQRSLGYSNKWGLLLGTNHGLFSLVGKRFIALNQEHQVFSERVQRIISLPSGWQVICTLGAGIIFWDDEHLFTLNTSNGLNSNLCNDIYAYTDSTFWICSNRGINKVVFQPKQRRLEVTKSFTIENGLLSNEVFSIYADDQEIWAATNQGLNQLPLNSLKKNNYQPPIYISEVRLGNVKAENQESVHYTNNSVQINYIGLSYKWPKNLTYRFRLLGSDNETWQTTKQTNITYSTLNSGAYTFEVEAINTSGYKSSSPAQFSFEIQTPFWRTFSFYIGLFIFLIITLFLINRQNIQRIKKRAHLFQELDEYKNKALRSQMNPHFIYNSLNTIQSFILKNETENSMSYLSKFSRLMRLTFKNSSSNLVSLKQDLKALKLYTDLETVRYPTQLNIQYDITVDFPDSIFIPPLLIQPFVENAIKHGILPKKHGGDIYIRIRQEMNQLFVSIKDNGVGFDASSITQQRKKWNEIAIMQNMGSQTVTSIRESGITVTKSRIALHNERIKGVDPIIHIKPNSDQNGTLIYFYILLIEHPKHDQDDNY